MVGREVEAGGIAAVKFFFINECVDAKLTAQSQGISWDLLQCYPIARLPVASVRSLVKASPRKQGLLCPPSFYILQP